MRMTRTPSVSSSRRRGPPTSAGSPSASRPPSSTRSSIAGSVRRSAGVSRTRATMACASGCTRPAGNALAGSGSASAPRRPGPSRPSIRARPPRPDRKRRVHLRRRVSPLGRYGRLRTSAVIWPLLGGHLPDVVGRAIDHQQRAIRAGQRVRRNGVGDRLREDLAPRSQRIRPARSAFAPAAIRTSAHRRPARARAPASARPARRSCPSSPARRSLRRSTRASGLCASGSPCRPADSAHRLACVPDARDRRWTIARAGIRPRSAADREGCGLGDGGLRRQDERERSVQSPIDQVGAPLRHRVIL